MYVWTLLDGTKVYEGDEIEVKGYVNLTQSLGGNPSAFFSEEHSEDYFKGYDMITVRFPSNYKYINDDCHVFKLSSVSLAYPELKYDPTQQGDTDEDI